MKRKGIFKMILLIILGIIVLGVVIGVAIGWSYLAKEHKEAKNLSIAHIDFTKLKDGTYTGEYAGGMYKWRVNKAQVTISSGKVTDIKLVSTSGPGASQNKDYIKIYDRIKKAQSLQVDTISGATLTSKAYLKAVEIALIKAEKK